MEQLSDKAKKISIMSDDDYQLPEFTPGSNIEVSIPVRPGDEPRPFSITSDARDTSSYQLIVVDNQNDYASKNSWLVRKAQLGDRLDISMPRSGITFDDDEVGYFIAGGSGITAFLSHFNSVDLVNKRYQLFHIVNSEGDGSSIIDRDLSNLIDIDLIVFPENPAFKVKEVLEGKDTSKSVYVAGPNSLIVAVYHAALELGWAESKINWDSYALPGNPAEVEASTM